jgi:hypothetical protein
MFAQNDARAVGELVGVFAVSQSLGNRRSPNAAYSGCSERGGQPPDAKRQKSERNVHLFCPSEDKRERAHYGVHHSISERHLPLYVDEFAFRLNEGNCRFDTIDRLESLVRGVAGKRLTWAMLTRGS